MLGLDWCQASECMIEPSIQRLKLKPISNLIHVTRMKRPQTKERNTWENINMYPVESPPNKGIAVIWRAKKTRPNGRLQSLQYCHGSSFLHKGAAKLWLPKQY